MRDLDKWPRNTRSHDFALDFAYLNCFGIYCDWDIWDHFQNHVTLNFKVIRQGHAFGSSLNELGLPDPQNIRNKPKFFAIACVEGDIGNVMCKIMRPWIYYNYCQINGSSYNKLHDP